MKPYVCIVIILLSFSVYSQKCDDTPDLNEKIIKSAEKQLSKKVGRGECWDLAEFVLNEHDADWDGYEKYGRLIDHDSECLYPGDIIQFEKIKIQYKEGHLTYTENMYHHTAIIKEVVNEIEVVILHQNTEKFGRKVGSSSLKFDTIVSGDLLIYRPKEN